MIYSNIFIFLSERAIAKIICLRVSLFLSQKCILFTRKCLLLLSLWRKRRTTLKEQFPRGKEWRRGDRVTRYLDNCLIFGHLQPCQFAQLHINFAKVVSKICHLLIKPSKFCQSLNSFCQIGEISPNLVTLHGAIKTFFALLEMWWPPKHWRSPQIFLPPKFIFVYFHPFPVIISIIQIEINVDGVLGTWTCSRTMVGTDKTTELWQPPPPPQKQNIFVWAAASSSQLVKQTLPAR